MYKWCLIKIILSLLFPINEQLISLCGLSNQSATFRERTITNECKAWNIVVSQKYAFTEGPSSLSWFLHFEFYRTPQIVSFFLLTLASVQYSPVLNKSLFLRCIHRIISRLGVMAPDIFFNFFCLFLHASLPILCPARDTRTPRFGTSRHPLYRWLAPTPSSSQPSFF